MYYVILSPFVPLVYFSTPKVHYYRISIMTYLITK